MARCKILYHSDCDLKNWFTKGLTGKAIRALHPSKLDIGYCQKSGDIDNLKSGYWILPTENGILGY